MSDLYLDHSNTEFCLWKWESSLSDITRELLPYSHIMKFYKIKAHNIILAFTQVKSTLSNGISTCFKEHLFSSTLLGQETMVWEKRECTDVHNNEGDIGRHKLLNYQNSPVRAIFPFIRNSCNLVVENANMNFFLWGNMENYKSWTKN